jgi:lysozyme family protein
MFWDKVWGDKMPIGLDYLLFDMAVNSGPGRSIMLLQRAVGTTPDGGMGPVTYAATVTHDPVDLIEKFSEAKVEFYESLSTFPTFGKGWLNRVAHVEKQALEMVKQNGQES